MNKQHPVLWLGLLTVLAGIASAQPARKATPRPQANARLVIAFDTMSKPLRFGVSQLEKAFRQSGQAIRLEPLNSAAASAAMTIRVESAQTAPSVRAEGYQLAYQNNKLLITAVDPVGAMYGAMDVAEQIRMGKTWKTISPKTANPRLAVRALKVNLPWSPYRTGPAMDAHLDICRDLNYWQRLLDQMA